MSAYSWALTRRPLATSKSQTFLEHDRLAGRLEDGGVGELCDEVVSGLDDLIDVDVEGLPHLCAAGVPAKNLAKASWPVNSPP